MLVPGPMTMNKMIEEEGIAIGITSGFGHNTQRPFVQMLIERADWMTQMSPAEARNLAFNLLQAADGAESDGFLVTFLREKADIDDMSAIAGLLVEFREYREMLRREDAPRPEGA